MSIDECKAKHSRRQIRIWLKFFAWEFKQATADQWYMAQIAQAIHNKPTYGYKAPKQKEIKDKLIPFVTKGEAKKTNSGVPDGIKPWEYSRAVWCAAVGLPTAKPTNLPSDQVHG